MTDFILQLQLWPDGTIEELAEANAVRRLFRNLRFAERDWGPYRLAGWAEMRDIELAWVDSASLRVPCTDEQAEEFLTAIGAADTLPPSPPNFRYVVQASEF